MPSKRDCGADANVYTLRMLWMLAARAAAQHKSVEHSGDCEWRRLAYQRITLAGHRDKGLEYGQDLWMKYRLPSSQFIYFGIQVKKGKLDSAGRTKTGNENITEALNQIPMALKNPVMHPEVNRKVLIDHVFLIASGDITKPARNFLGEHLDVGARRQVLFMDRDEIVNLLIFTNLELPVAPSDPAIPF